MRLGIFGGTFDPPHLGHLIVAQDAWAALELDRLLFVPARQPPHKRERPISAARHRLAMLRAAIGADERFDISDVELRREGPSYTVDTLRDLGGDAELFFLLGADQFREFHTWRAPAEIVELATVVVLSRPGSGGPADVPHDLPGRVLEVTRIDVSSTLVRERVRAGQPIRYLVADGVEEIIRGEGLYR